MEPTTLEIIKIKVESAKGIPTAMIEYNFDLPKAKGIKKDNFLGVKAIFNPNMVKGQANVIYRYG